MRKGFTLIELLVVIAIIAILAVVVVLTLNPAELLKQSRDANRVSDMATLTSALNLYTTDQAGASSFSLGNVSNTAISVFDPQASSTCGSLGLPSLNTSTGQAWLCSTSSTYRNINNTGWIPVNLNAISAGSPIGNLPVDPTNQTSTGLFYSYNTNGSQFEVTANLEASKYKLQYGNTPQTNYFPEVISGGTQGISALYNPTGLVGYWSLDEGTGITAFDTSGNGNNGTWSGTQVGTSGYYSGGKVGSWAGAFNGSNDCVSMPNIPTSGSGPFSIVSWIKTSTTGTRKSIVSYGAGTTGEAIYLFINTSNQVEADLTSEAGTASVATVTDGNWHQAVIVVNSGNYFQIYVDGQPSGTSVHLVPNIQAGFSDIGCATTVWYFSSLIDDVRVYNRALSAAEVQAMYNAEH